MLAREKWQVKTIEVLERVFQERLDQFDQHGGAMELLPDGVGPNVPWCDPVIDVSLGAGPMPATEIEEVFRENYNGASDHGRLTRMHLVREEVAEAFECDPDSPEFIEELVQVAALCVQWLEYKLP